MKRIIVIREQKLSWHYYSVTKVENHDTLVELWYQYSDRFTFEHTPICKIALFYLDALT